MNKNKKGLILGDIIFIGITLFTLAIIVLFASSFMRSFVTGASGTSLNITLLEKSAYSLDTFNAGFLFLLIGFFIFIIISAFTLKGHPAFLIFFIFLLLMGVFFSGIMSNAYNTFTNTTSLGTETARFDILNNVMANLPLIVFILGIVAGLILYGSVRGI